MYLTLMWDGHLLILQESRCKNVPNNYEVRQIILSSKIIKITLKYGNFCTLNTKEKNSRNSEYGDYIIVS